MNNYEIIIHEREETRAIKIRFVLLYTCNPQVSRCCAMTEPILGDDRVLSSVCIFCVINLQRAQTEVQLQATYTHILKNMEGNPALKFASTDIAIIDGFDRRVSPFNT